MTPEAQRLLLDAAFHAWVDLGEIIAAKGKVDADLLDCLRTDYEALANALKAADPKLAAGQHPPAQETTP